MIVTHGLNVHCKNCILCDIVDHRTLCDVDYNDYIYDNINDIICPVYDTIL